MGTHAPQGTGEITEPTGQIETPPGQQLEVEENPEGQPPEVVEQSQALRRDYKNVHKRLLWKNVSVGNKKFLSDMVTMIRMMRDELLYETSRL